jgi:hypothetical protein
MGSLHYNLDRNRSCHPDKHIQQQLGGSYKCPIDCCGWWGTSYMHNKSRGNLLRDNLLRKQPEMRFCWAMYSLQL